MTPSVDPSPPRRPIFFPVVIATVFLTIIAMTAGFVLGERHKDRVRADNASQTSEPLPEGTTTGAESTTGPSGKSCPDETRKTAAGLGLPSELRQVLKIVTDNETVVWICEDPSGALYYQGKTGGVDAPLVEKQNGLFLSDVVRVTDGEYEARAANGNRIVVNREVLEVHFTDDRGTQTNQVVTAE